METEGEADPSGWQTTPEIDAAARALTERWQQGDQRDLAFRAACGGTLAELRAAFRRRPEAFSPATVSLLREVGRALSIANGDPQRVPAPPRDEAQRAKPAGPRRD